MRGVLRYRLNGGLSRIEAADEYTLNGKPLGQNGANGSGGLADLDVPACLGPDIQQKPQVLWHFPRSIWGEYRYSRRKDKYIC